MQKHILPIALAITILMPLHVHAASIRADDSVAGLGTAIDISDLDTNQAVDIVITPPFGPEMITAVQADAMGTAQIQLPGRETEVAGKYKVTIEDGEVQLEAVTTFEILPDAMSSASTTMQLASDYVAADGSDQLEVIIIVRDRYGNPLARRPIKLISSRSADRIESASHETDSRGEQRFELTTHEPGNVVLRALDLISGTILPKELIATAGSSLQAVGGSMPQQVAMYGSNYNDDRFFPSAPFSTLGANLLGNSFRAQTSVEFGLVDHFEINTPSELSVNEDATIVITAVDRAGNRVEDYTGLVLLDSTDPMAYLPVSGEIKFLPRHLGQVQLTLGLRFRSAGDHVLRARDSQNTDAEGRSYIEVTGGQSAAQGAKLIKITSPEEGILLNVSRVTVTGIADPFVNLNITGGLETVEGDTEIDGTFSIDVELDPNATEHILSVQDDSGLMISGDFTILTDVTAPVIESIIFTPENPIEGSNVLLVVKTEPGTIDIEMEFNGMKGPIEPSANNPGTFQTLLDAPKAGSYPAIIRVVDRAGNISEDSATLQVALKGLPQVQNLVAQAEMNAVTLEWDAIETEEVDAYRIYVGETPEEFGFSLETNYATTAAQVAGLRPGTDYYFTVTALQGERESEIKSDVVRVTVLGVRLDILSGNSSITLDWSSLQTNTSLSSFILEFGVEPDIFTEERFLNGELRNYTLRDLINGVQYYLRLTPVSITGVKIENLASSGEAMPTSAIAGFRPQPAEPAPFTIGGDMTGPRRIAPGNLHSGAPALSEDGLPLYAWWVLGTIGAFGLMIYWDRKKKMQTTVFLQSMEKQYRRVNEDGAKN
ncbi:MAG: Ig-like domain-containing protein [bacterium]|nr:Ig-like domain-containing protein [bacterium]